MPVKGQNQNALFERVVELEYRVKDLEKRFDDLEGPDQQPGTLDDKLGQLLDGAITNALASKIGG